MKIPLNSIFLRGAVCTVLLAQSCYLNGCCRVDNSSWRGSSRLGGKASQSRCRVSQDNLRRALAVVANPASPDIDFKEAIEEISTAPVVETLQFWIRIVNNSGMSNARRRACLFQLFKRHFMEKTPLATIGASLGKLGWFNAKTIRTVTVVESLPVQRDGSIYKFQLPFMKEEHSALLLRMSTQTSKAQVLALLSGKDQDKSVYVAELGFGLPWSERIKNEFNKPTDL